MLLRPATSWLMAAALSLVAVLSLRQLHRALRDGVLEFTKKRSEDNTQMVFYRDTEPFRFWGLFCFYVVLLFGSLSLVGLIAWKANSAA